jgi:hypothetical protein
MEISRRKFSLLGAGAAAATLSGAPAARVATSTRPATSMSNPARNVVLVHGAHADGSSWAKVTPLLQAAGIIVTAVQNPLTSLADDVAATNFALARQDGPRSWSHTPTAAPSSPRPGLPRMSPGLVYVAARAPEAGEDFAALSATFPTPPVTPGIITTADRFLSGLRSRHESLARRCCATATGHSSREFTLRSRHLPPSGGHLDRVPAGVLKR